VGALFTALLPILAPDIRWNQGLLRPVEIVSPPGLVCNAEFPAPVSSATVAAMWVVASVANSALSRLAACASATRREAAAVSKGSIQIVTLGGLDRDGSPYGTLLLDATAGGGGAYEDHDGLDAAGDYCVPRPTITNVESNESNGPLLYLYRRIVPDTSGAGRMRGGSAMGLALTPHDTPGLDAMLITHGVEVPNSTGQFGGLEASCNDNGVLSEAGDDLVGLVDGPEMLAAAGVVRPLGAKPGFFPLAAGDVFTYTFQGGGGYGDPIERDPDAVRRDVDDEALTEGFAERIYGVVRGPGGDVDGDATAARRLAIRTARLGHAPPRAPGTGFERGAIVEIGHALALTADRVIACRCGQELGPANGNWKDGALRRTVAPEEHGPRLRLHEELELREHVCPGCGTLLEAEVARKGAADIFSIEIA
jgi:N-methylhydantoinase B